MQRDIRNTDTFRELEALSIAVRQPGTGQISDAIEVNAAPDGSRAVFAGTLMDRLEGSPPTRICMTDLADGNTRVLTFGAHTDRLPKFSPDGHRIAFSSDRSKEGNFQLHLLDPGSGAAHSTPPVEGWVEYLHWSPDGERILLGVAGHGADTSGGQGAVASALATENSPSWMPHVKSGQEQYRWRDAWVYDLAANTVRKVSAGGTNVWEAAWCGNGALAAIVSNGPVEGLWYSARLQIINVQTGESRDAFTPRDQMGLVSASPSGHLLAFVQAVCSDRWIVAGDLGVMDTATGTVRKIDTKGVDITHTEWRSDRALLLAGHRGFETVIGLWDAANGDFRELWASREISTGGFYVVVSGFRDAGDCLMLGRSFIRGPEIALIRGGKYKPVKSFDLDYSRAATVINAVDQVTWLAPDDLKVQGWLLRPHGEAPFPVVMNLHGGPVWHWHPVGVAAPFLALLKRGYAVFMPNPRGSSGRGQEFARRVLGDVCGADGTDCLVGLDHLVNCGIADSKRLGITGGSYGGQMTAWLITQDSRFAAAVPVAPVTNHVTGHLVSNIPQFVKLFLGDSYRNPDGKYFRRSSIMHAHKVRTPTLIITGALDRCTPPEEAVQFHNALLENGANSVLVTYPEEGHGVRKFPAAIDYAARIVDWFVEHMPPNAPQDIRPVSNRE